jgi:hypothetical protein
VSENVSARASPKTLIASSNDNPVFLQIARGLLIVPFELEHVQYLKGLTLEATGTQQAPRNGNLLLCVRVGRQVKSQG